LRNFSYICKAEDLTAEDFLESSALPKLIPQPVKPTKKRPTRDPDEFYSPGDMASNVVSTRPKRARESRPIHFDEVSPHSLITLDPLEIQPFMTNVSLTSYLVMMIHGLLYKTEIIGLLAGLVMFGLL
jgi:hypothetical protein